MFLDFPNKVTECTEPEGPAGTSSGRRRSGSRENILAGYCREEQAFMPACPKVEYVGITLRTTGKIFMNKTTQRRKEISELNKQISISYRWVDVLNSNRMSALPTLIQRLDVSPVKTSESYPGGIDTAIRK